MKSTLFEKIRQYINLMPRTFDCPAQQRRYSEKVASPDTFHAEIDMLEKKVNTLKHLDVSFCHNDLLVANYIYDKKHGKLHVQID